MAITVVYLIYILLMNREQLALTAALDNSQKRLNAYFTIDRLKNDLFGAESMVVCSTYDCDANYFDIELKRSERFFIMSSKVIAYGPDVSLIIIEVEIGDSGPPGTPRGHAYFGNFRYNHLFELIEVELRNFY